MTFDLVLRGGHVLDGTGRPPLRADVGIRAGRIEEIGDLTASVGDAIDATSMYVAPGFIDVHAHTDLLAFLHDEHEGIKTAGIRQGVTTEVSGNCGASPFPVRADAQDDPYLGAMSAGGTYAFASLSEYREAMAARPFIANVAPLLGHGSVRACVLNQEARAPTEDELAEMRRLVAQALDDGAFGLSSGLIYAPGIFGGTDELIALAEELGRRGRPYTTHMRDEGDAVLEAVAEAVRIGREGGTSVEISHHKIAGRRNWGRSQETLSAIEAARRSGLEVTIDVYPYTAGSTFLAAVLPPWALEGGPQQMLPRLEDPDMRARMRREIAEGLPGWQDLGELAGWEDILLAGDPSKAGRSVEDLAHDDGLDELDWVARTLLENPATVIMLQLMEEGEVAAIGDQTFAMVGSDGVPIPGMQHPRLAGTFARMLARHAGDDARLADVVRRMTSLPADRFGVPDRGVVARGKVADLVVFDPRTVRDRATYEEPLLAPTGVAHVLVAGQLVVRGGDVTDRRPGKVLEPA